MRTRLLTCLATTGLCLTALGTYPVAAAPAGKSVSLSVLGSYASGVFGKSAAEITAYDPSTRRTFVVNAQSGAVDVLDVSDATSPTKLATLTVAGLVAADGSTIDPGAAVNSVDVAGGVLAVAVQAGGKTGLGWTAFYRTADLAPVGAVRVGSQPDMVVFADDETVLVANEAEPADDFSSDPEGSVSVIDLAAGVTQSGVRTARFTAYDEGLALPSGVRVFGPDVAVPAGLPAAGRVARNLEPEYITTDGKTAWITLQEANTVAVLDVSDASFTDLWPLPAKSWSAPGNVLDASDRDASVNGGINVRNWPVKGLAMPDAITSYKVGGETFLVTANEGDAREFGAYAEGVRVGSANLCAAEFPDAASLKLPANLGRLSITKETGFDAARGCFAELNAFGARSFTILDESGAVVFESGAQLETKIAELVANGMLPKDAFNATHDTNPSFDTRSDDKGIEPEGVDVGKVGGRHYAFVGLERIGGLMVFDVTVPTAPTFVQYVNNRDFTVRYTSNGVGAAAARDLGAEGVEFIAGEDSPTGEPVVAVANEVSGTTTLFAVDALKR